MPRVNKANNYGFDAREQKTRTYTGMGDDINVHDQWAIESQGPIQDRTREHLGSTDKAIINYRSMLMKAIEQVETGSGGRPLMVLDQAAAKAIRGPVTVDGIAPAAEWQAYWRDVDARKRRNAPWPAPALEAAE
jgi:phthalate 4,5-dioxygenase